ncbi:hypothetical protein [Hwanghaeella sp.]|uniref:hypothetical protein n=1 Tax=Hwanghaeella sp. TaxID=2605943 RepID=UPI003CCBA0FA
MQNNATAVPPLTDEYRKAAHKKMTAYTAATLAGASVPGLRKGLAEAVKRYRLAANMSECPTKHAHLARDRVVAHQIMMELERRGVPASLEVA